MVVTSTTKLISDNDHLITITTSGYSDMTHNLLKSMQKIALDKLLWIYCFDQESYDYFIDIGHEQTKLYRAKGYKQDNQWLEYSTNSFGSLMFSRFELIKDLLVQGKNVLHIDGDVIFLKSPFEIMSKLIKDHDDVDMLIQNNSLLDEDLREMCMGFYYLRSSEKIIDLFSNINVVPSEWDNCDQRFFNAMIRDQLNYLALPLSSFPNGKYIYESSSTLNENTLVAHFNWIIGQKKIQRMKEYGVWFM